MPESRLDFKFIENYFKNTFSRPFMRKMKYIYWGLDHDDDIVVLSNTKDTDFKYCEPLQTTSLVKIHNKSHRDMFYLWLEHIGVNLKEPGLLYFGALITMLSKVSWDSVKFRSDDNGSIFIHTETDCALIAKQIDTYFTLFKLQTYVDTYKSVFFDNTHPSYYLPIPDGLNKIVRIPFSCDILIQENLLKTPLEDFDLLLLQGIENLQTKSLIQNKTLYETGVRVWVWKNFHCINYGGFYKDADISLCSVRDNIAIFPKKKKKEISHVG